MSLLWRSWLAFVGVIATSLMVLAVLCIFQHDALLSRLIQQRLSVIAQTTASSFRSVVDLGLPLSMMRNADAILQRAKVIDTAVTEVLVFNPSGVVVYSTNEDRAGSVPKKINQAFYLSKANSWSVETAASFNSGFTIKDTDGAPVGAVVVTYPKREFFEKTEAMAERISAASVLLLGVGAILAFIILRMRMAATIRALSNLEPLVERFRKPGKSIARVSSETHSEPDTSFLAREIAQIAQKLNKADKQYKTVTSQLAKFGEFSDKTNDVTGDREQLGETVLAGQ